MKIVGLLFVVVLYFGIIGAMIGGMWKTFTKAGKPGWASIVPIYNMITLLEIAEKPPLWLLFLLVPFANIYFFCMTIAAVARNFGKDLGFTVGLVVVPPVFWALLGFGDAQYRAENQVVTPLRRAA